MRGGPLRSKIERRIRLACVLTLIALGLMSWSLVDPRPIPVIVAMSAGQALGTCSLLLFIVAVLLDLRRSRVITLGDAPPASLPPSSLPPSRVPAGGGEKAGEERASEPPAA